MDEQQLQLYDTTLRDGMQQEGMSVSVDEKARIALKLDELGIGFIEGGFPASNPKEIEFFRRMRDERLVNAELVAFGMTRRKGVAAEADESLRVLAEIFTPTVAIVGKTWGLHLSKVIRVSRDENLRMIDESVRFLTAHGKRVVYDAEHFFDAWRDDNEYALRCATAAAEAGAAVVCLCDTNGASLPPFVADVVRAVTAALPGTRIGIHAHNDSDCAVASSLVAVEAGARQVQGTVNGYGERCGNANLVSIIPGLKLKMGRDVVSDEQLERLTETSHFVAEVVNAAVWAHAPYVGRSAFAHKGGMHVAAVEKAPETFEHVDPEKVGNEQRIVVSELSGKGAVVRKAQELGLQLEGDDARVATVLRRLKTREHEGYHYEAADASFDLLLREELAPARAAVPPRELPRHRREARGRQGGRRGDHQGPRRRRAHHQHRRGQRPRERARLGPAAGDREQVSAPRRHRAGQLQGAHPRRDQGHRRRHPRPAGRQRRGRELGQHRREREHHRGELGGPGRLDRVRDAARPARLNAHRTTQRRGAMSDADKVLEVMAEAGEPLNAGAVAERSGLDRKSVDKAMAELKKDGRIESPKRCYWAPKT